MLNVPDFVQTGIHISGIESLDWIIPEKDANGRTVESITVTGATSVDTETQDLKPGTYISNTLAEAKCVGNPPTLSASGASWVTDSGFSRIFYTDDDRGWTADATLTFGTINYAPDNVPPVITAPGDTTIELGSTFDPMTGVKATDDVDGDITKNVQVTGKVDVNTLGLYTLKYDVSDSSGNKADTVTRVITVVKPYLKQMPTTGVSSELMPLAVATISGLAGLLLAVVKRRKVY